MKVNEKTISEIKKLGKKENLERVLESNYPNAEIFVIRGLDRFDYSHYVKDAFFDREKAYSKMIKIPPNGSVDMCDTYEIYAETPKSLKNSRTFDDIDKMFVYENLNKNYSLGFED